MNRFPFVTRDHHEQALAALKATTAHLQRLLDTAQADRNAAQAQRDTACSAHEDVVRQLAAAVKANTSLAGRNKALAGNGQARTVSDVPEEHDVHRKALADALGEQKWHLNWGQLIGEVSQLRKAAEESMAEAQAERARADLLDADATVATAEEIAAWEARVKAHRAWTPPRDQDKRPVDGASGRPTHPATDLRRALDRCMALQARIDQRGKRVTP
ncbi:hypothetical protein [Streptomyces aureus]|uniref:hypothetical protein n=1 Tax=Streptomyces aureus TaxID=193461 RepID=UPI00055A5506|nr:hypothetical protein [Streptomyces aureus]